MKQATMSDVAKAANVSTMTVSKALNEKPGVSEETRRRILDIAKKMNYTPNFVAKSMRNSQTKTLGLVISDSSYSFFPRVIKGIEDRAVEAGYALLLCNTNGDHQTEWEKINLLLSKRVDGIVLAASTFTSEEDVKLLKSLGTPFVYSIRMPVVGAVDHVVNDNRLGSFMMVDYLLRTGSPKIHFFNMDFASTSATLRLKGYKQALEKYGYAFDETLVHHINHTIESGYALAKQMLSRGEAIEAIFCGCDIIAVGVMQAILEMGFQIPGDIRVASYDDIEWAPYLQVPLTTVHQPKYQIGQKSVDLLLKRIEDPARPFESVILEPELRIRQSAKKMPGQTAMVELPETNG